MKVNSEISKRKMDLAALALHGSREFAEWLCHTLSAAAAFSEMIMFNYTHTDTLTHKHTHARTRAYFYRACQLKSRANKHISSNATYM